MIKEYEPIIKKVPIREDLEDWVKQMHGGSSHFGGKVVLDLEKGVFVRQPQPEQDK